jgi:uncharacterized membrane protein YgaE (UPF0421/DUF939 family)
MEKQLKDVGSRFKKYLEHKEITINQMGKMSDNEGTQIYNIINGKKYGIDKFIKLIKQTPDLDLYWLLWNEGGDKNMLRANNNLPQRNNTNQNLELLSQEIETFRSTIAYQNITIEVYKNALEIAKSSIEDLRKIVDLYSKNDASDKNDQLNMNAG